MGLIKSIFCKIHHIVINFNRNRFTDSVCDTALYPLFFIAVYKVMLLFFHYAGLFFGHGPSDQIASAQRIACQFPYDLHNLFLIDDTAVSGFQYFFKLGTIICNAFGIILTFQIFWNKIHGAGTVKGNPGNDIFQVPGF